MTQLLLDDPGLKARVKARLDPRHYEHLEGKEGDVYWAGVKPGQKTVKEGWPGFWLAGVNTRDYERHEKMNLGNMPVRGGAKYIFQEDDLEETISHEIRHDAPEIALDEERNRLEDIIHSGHKLNSREALKQWARWMQTRDDTWYSINIPEEGEAIARDYGKAIGKFMGIHEELNFMHKFRQELSAK